MPFVRRASIHTRILGLPVLFLVGLLLLQGADLLVDLRIRDHVVFPSFEAQVLAGHQNTLKALVEAEALSLGELLKAIPPGPERQAAIEKQTDPPRFFPDKSGYFFVYDLTGVRLNVPPDKSANGKNLLGLQDKKGNRFIEEMVAKAKAGGGYVRYYFEKPGKGVQPKLSYVTLVPGSDLFVGTGVYIDNVEEEVQALRARLAAENSRYGLFKLGMLLAAFVVVAVVSLLITRAITRGVAKISQGLAQASVQVADSAGQLSVTSQQLAEGSSRQASALQSSSAALEQMGSMTSTNAANARQADGLMGQTRQVVEQADQAMSALTGAMREISEASLQTSKIVKTIDEIAFQTNLLALNAAVEAARAGEAGAGFAVVADEVRSLAQRAAEAARDTARMIEGTVSKISDGSGLVDRTAQAFEGVTASTGKVGGLVGEISHASQEQALGIEQLSLAITAMDQVTQANSAHAQEAAAAAEQMNGQARQLHALVEDLESLAGANSGRARANSARKRGGRADGALLLPER